MSIKSKQEADSVYEWIEININDIPNTYDIPRNGEAFDKIRIMLKNSSESIDHLVINLESLKSVDKWDKSCNPMVYEYLNYDSKQLNILLNKGHLVKYEGYIEIDIPTLYLISLQHMKVSMKTTNDVSDNIYIRYIYYSKEYRRTLAQCPHQHAITHMAHYMSDSTDFELKNHDGNIKSLIFESNCVVNEIKINECDHTTNIELTNQEYSFGDIGINCTSNAITSVSVKITNDNTKRFLITYGYKTVIYYAGHLYSLGGYTPRPYTFVCDDRFARTASDKVIAFYAPMGNLQKVPLDIYKCTNLQTIDLRYNNISEINLTPLTKLQTINLSNNLLTTLALHTQKELTFLDVSDTYLTHIYGLKPDAEISSNNCPLLTHPTATTLWNFLGF